MPRRRRARRSRDRRALRSAAAVRADLHRRQCRDRVARSDQDGRYRLDRRARRRAHTSACASSATPRTTVPVTVAGGQTATANVRLRVQPLNLDAVVVTGQGGEISKRRIATNVDVVELRGDRGLAGEAHRRAAAGAAAGRADPHDVGPGRHDVDHPHARRDVGEPDFHAGHLRRRRARGQPEQRRDARPERVGRAVAGRGDERARRPARSTTSSASSSSRAARPPRCTARTPRTA